MKRSLFGARSARRPLLPIGVLMIVGASASVAWAGDPPPDAPVKANGEAQATEARARTDALIKAFQKVQRPTKGATLSAEAAKANETAFAALDAYFDRDRLVGDPIAPFKDKLTEAQQQRYTEVFWKTLRLITYTDSGAFFQKAQLKFQPPVMKVVNGTPTAAVALNAYIEEDDAETDVIFHWAKGAKGWRLVDTSFDGASLVKDYQNQFGRIIKKEGAEALLSKLEARFAEVSKAKGLTP